MYLSSDLWRAGELYVALSLHKVKYILGSVILERPPDQIRLIIMQLEDSNYLKENYS